MTLTASASLEVRRGTTGDFTDLSDQPAGISGWNETVTQRNRQVPSIPGILAVQLLTIRDGNVSFTVDDNERTHPLMFMRSGEAFDVRIKHDASGTAGITYSGIASINMTSTPGGTRGFQFSLTVTALAETT